MGPLENSKPKFKIIDSFWTFLVATAVLGPLALPLLWRNPKYKKSTKIVGSLVVVGFTLYLVFFAKSYMDNVMAEYKQLMEQSQ
jgi:hypothetical protein